jgi:hypothetical protein
MKKKMKIVIGVSIGFIVLLLVWMFWLMPLSKKNMELSNTLSANNMELSKMPKMSDRHNRQISSEAERHERIMPMDSLQAIDRIIKKMDLGNIAFNVPQNMNLYDSTIIHLVLGVEKEIEDIKRMIEEKGEKVGARIRVSNRMEARLSGSNFAITAISPEVQAVSKTEVTEWKWEIKPKEDGKQFLHLTLSALLNIEGENTPRVIRTFDRIILVEVTIYQQAKIFVKSNWQWLWTFLLVPIVVWLWKKINPLK